METAICIATSAKLVSKDHNVYCFPEVKMSPCRLCWSISGHTGFYVSKVSSRHRVHAQLNDFRRKSDCALVITGKALEACGVEVILNIPVVTWNDCVGLSWSL